MKPGRFITLEGGEGVGKSTNLRFLENYLSEMGKSVVVTREPGGTEVGEKIRSILLDSKQPTMATETELLLLFAVRAEHIRNVIRPALKDGRWVLCDRFTDATYAYQGGGRGMAKQRIQYLESWIQEGLKPDLTLLFDAPVDIGLERARKRGALDRFESERLEFFSRVRERYLEIAALQSDRIRVIDACEPIDRVQQELRLELAGLD